MRACTRSSPSTSDEAPVAPAASRPPRARVADRTSGDGSAGPARAALALRILWELREQPAATFRELQLRCGKVSSSVLNERLRELREAGILTAGDRSGYELTDERPPTALGARLRSTSGLEAGAGVRAPTPRRIPPRPLA